MAETISRLQKAFDAEQSRTVDLSSWYSLKILSNVKDAQTDI